MTFRSRLLITFLVTVLVPMVAVALLIRGEMGNRLTSQYQRRVDALVAVIEEDLALENDEIARALDTARNALLEDNRFRQAVAGASGDERRYVLDFASGAMRLTGLSMLQIQDEGGRIVSSGHFRNEYDRLEPELPALLLTMPDKSALVRARAPDEPFVALVRASAFRIAGESFTIVGGVRVGSRFLERLTRSDNLTVTLRFPGGELASSPAATLRQARQGEASPRAGNEVVVQELKVPFVDSEKGEIGSATFRVAHRADELHALRRSIDRWFLLAILVTSALTVIVVSWVASRISRPLSDLADKTARIDLDRLDVDFSTPRRDEIGVLSRLLGAMTDRLRVSASEIKDAERRATLGEMARQVNHDIKNGLTPIRNVFRHLAQTTRSNPSDLPRVFGEREPSLDSSISYLENLASNYARLSKRREPVSCHVDDIIRQVVGDRAGRGYAIEARVDGPIVVVGDPLSLRRVIENLVDNAVDSLESRDGTITVSATCVDDEGSRATRIVVADSGRGMSGEQKEKAFDDFYTTKVKGTGLGLSIVRRLVMDLGGSIQLQSEPGEGTRVIIELPMLAVT